MDAHVFRRLCDSLSNLLTGARLQKIRSPAENIHIFSFHIQSQNLTLVLHHGRRNPFLHVTKSRYNYGKVPSAQTMRLRKYLSGRRVKYCACNWIERCIHLCLHTPTQEGQVETWLSLDLRHGPLLILGQAPESLLEHKIEYNSELCHIMDTHWPVPEHMDDFFSENTENIENIENILIDHNPSNLQNTNKLPTVINANIHEKLLWQAWPIFTPALRQTMPFLKYKEKLSLMIDLEYGGGDLYVYEDCTSKKMEVFAWPLPKNLQKERLENIIENPIEALALVGDNLINTELAGKSNKFFHKSINKEVKRLEKILYKLDKEEIRLRNMLALKEDALYLKLLLWRLNSEQKLTLFPRAMQNMADHYLCSEIDRINSHMFLQSLGQNKSLDCSLESKYLALNPALSISENMINFFHQAKRGQRGLGMLGARRELLLNQVIIERNKSSMQTNANTGNDNILVQKQALAKNNKNNTLRTKVQYNLLPKNIESFVSNDGFTVLRGKDAKGNLALLKMAKPFDFWVHVLGGKSAHVLIKRSFAQQEIAKETLAFAGVLAAQKSWQKHENKVCIQIAEACHVKPIRNEKSGTVQIDKLELTMWVDMP